MSPVLVAVLLAARPGAVPSHGDVIGEAGGHVVMPGESLVELARDWDVGFNAVAAANPLLDPFVPRAGAVAVVPTAWILPAAAAPGTLVVNLSEMRLYLLAPSGALELTFPIGVAVDDGATPLGALEIVEKTVEPTWYPTPSVREEDPTLPAAVPPGPDNPLGSHALRLSMRRILVHGTNRPLGVGRKVSHGCIRLYPEDIPRLFERVEIGTRVVIVREPVKVGVREGRIYVELHCDDAVDVSAYDEAVRILFVRGVLHRVNRAKLAWAARTRSGLPVDVTASTPGQLVDLTAGP
jgi:L,D-transpeptidase ErfK/SrfK